MSFWAKKPQDGEQKKPAGAKQPVVKPRYHGNGPRNTACPAWPNTGSVKGAPIEWCRQNRGAMDNCATCDWRKI